MAWFWDHVSRLMPFSTVAPVVPADWGDPIIPSDADTRAAEKYKDLLAELVSDITKCIKEDFKHPRTHEARALWLTLQAYWSCMQTLVLRRAMYEDSFDPTPYDQRKVFLLPAYVFKPTPATELAFRSTSLNSKPWEELSGLQMAQQINEFCDHISSTIGTFDTFHRVSMTRVDVLLNILRYGNLGLNKLRDLAEALSPDRSIIHSPEDWFDVVQLCMNRSIQHVSRVERLMLPEQWHQIPSDMASSARMRRRP